MKDYVSVSDGMNCNSATISYDKDGDIVAEIKLQDEELFEVFFDSVEDAVIKIEKEYFEIKVKNGMNICDLLNGYSNSLVKSIEFSLND